MKGMEGAMREGKGGDGMVEKDHAKNSSGTREQPNSMGHTSSRYSATSSPIVHMMTTGSTGESVSTLAVHRSLTLFRHLTLPSLLHLHQ